MVFAGHKHNLKLSRRNGQRYIVMGPTGANLGPSEVKQLGAFHHYATVTVEDDSAYIAIREPGMVWPEDISQSGFAGKLSGAVKCEYVGFNGVESAVPTLRYTISVTNPFDDTLSVNIRLESMRPGAWRSTSKPTQTLVLGPGQSETVRIQVSTKPGMLLPLPRVRLVTKIAGAIARDRVRKLSLYPDSVMGAVPDWMTLAPIPSGPVNTALIEGPQAAIPGVFAHPELTRGWSKASSGVDSLTWRELKADISGRVPLAENYGREDMRVAIASCAIYSPDSRSVLVSIAANDFANLAVNGKSAMSGRFCRLHSGAEYTWVRLDKGWNTLTSRVVNLGAGWWVTLRVADPQNDLKFAAHAP
jgi:hypothetical protein